MDAFLSELSQEGEQVSQGVFTMDISKAQLKLAKYQLGHFNQFVEFLISTLAASPATHLVADSKPSKFFSKGSTTITFVDWSLTADDVRTIGMSSLGLSERRDLKYFSILLSALASRYSLVLRSHHLEECIALRVTPDEVEVVSPDSLEELEERSDNYVSLVIGADISKILEANFSRLAQWSPKSIEVSGNFFSRGFKARTRFNQGLSYLQQSGVGEVPVVNPWPDRLRVLESAEAGSHPKFLGLTVDEAQEKDVGLNLLIDGLAYRCPVQLPRVYGYIVANELQRDLSYQNVVQNEVFTEIVRELRRSAAQLLVDLVSRDEVLKAETILSLQDLVSDLKQDHQLDVVEKRLFEMSGSLAATIHPPSLQVLLGRLHNMEWSDAEPILKQYRTQIVRTRRDGHLDETHQLINASSRCRLALGQETVVDDELRALVDILMSRDSRLELRREPMASYLSSLMAWQRNGYELPEWETMEVHPTWFLPMELNARWDAPGELDLPDAMTERSPAWLKILEHLRANRAQRALEFVEVLDELQFDSHRQAWNELFWTFYRGRVSWQTQVRLRVELTRSYMSDPRRAEVDLVSRFIQSTTAAYLEQSETSFLDCANYLSVKSYFGADFWPEFFTVIVQGKRQFSRVVRIAWTKLLAQALLGALLHSKGELSPLLGPMELPLRRDPDCL